MSQNRQYNSSPNFNLAQQNPQGLNQGQQNPQGLNQGNPTLNLGNLARKRSAADYHFGNRIGEGLYLSVFSAKDVHNGKTYAIKVLLKRHIVKEDKIKYVNIEKMTLHRLGYHPGIVQLYCTFQDDALLYFVLDFAEYGELLSIIRKFGLLSENVAKFYMVQLLDSIQFIHSHGIIHRDLKPENILVSSDLNIKITDFGAAKLLKDPTSNSNGNNSSNLDNNGHDLNPGEESGPSNSKKGSFVGTAEYVPPELLKSNECGYESDIWALACILYQFFHGVPPFKGSTEYLTFEKIINIDFRYSIQIPKDVAQIIDDILVPDPQQRPSLDQLKEYTWFKDVRWDRKSIWGSKVPRLEPYRDQTNVQPFVPTLKNGLNRNINKSNNYQQLQKEIYRGDSLIPMVQRLTNSTVPTPQFPASGSNRNSVLLATPPIQNMTISSSNGPSGPNTPNNGMNTGSMNSGSVNYPTNGNVANSPVSPKKPQKTFQYQYNLSIAQNPAVQYKKPYGYSNSSNLGNVNSPGNVNNPVNVNNPGTNGNGGYKQLLPAPPVTKKDREAEYPLQGQQFGYQGQPSVRHSDQQSPVNSSGAVPNGSGAAAAAAAASKGGYRGATYLHNFQGSDAIPPVGSTSPQKSSAGFTTPPAQSSSKFSSPRSESSRQKVPMVDINLAELSTLLGPNEKILKMDTILKAQLSHTALKGMVGPLNDSIIDKLIQKNSQKLTVGAVAVVTVITNQARVFFVDSSLNVMRIDLKANNGADYLLYDYEFEGDDDSESQTVEDANGILTKGGNGYLILELIREGGDLIFLKRVSTADLGNMKENVRVLKKNGDTIRLGPTYGWIDCLLLAKEMVNKNKNKIPEKLDRLDKPGKEKLEKGQAPKEKEREKTKSPVLGAPKPKKTPGPTTLVAKKEAKPISKFAYAAAAAVHK